MKNFLQTIWCVHANNYAHLDLKPGNILFKNKFSTSTKTIDDLDYALIDFGAAHIFRTDNSKKLSTQMASAAFSPPELLKFRFGKKSDVWAFGVISYLVCIRCFFFEANASKIFMGTDPQKILANIHHALSNLRTSMTPHYLNTKQTKKYLGVLETRFSVLIDFFTILFVEEKKRPTVKELLEHPLFKLV